MKQPFEEIRMGIVGVGRVALQRHIPSIRAVGASIVALADHMPGYASRQAQQLNIAHGYDDYRQLLDRDDIDAVAVCTPTHTHAEIAIAALKAGKHVYLDKPPTLNAAEMERVVAAAQETGMVLLTGSNSIYYNEIQALKRRIEADALGEIYYVECLKRFRRSLPRGWLKEKRFGGGIGLQTCSHRIDQVLYLLDTPGAVSVTARTYSKFAAHPSDNQYVPMELARGYAAEIPVSEVEDTLMAFIQFDNGCTFLLSDAYAANLPEEWTCNLWGTRAGAVLHPMFTRPDLPPLTLYSQDEYGLLTDTRPVIPPGPTGLGGEMVQIYRHFFESIQTGVEADRSPQRALVLMRILDAIYASAADGGKQVILQPPEKGQTRD